MENKLSKIAIFQKADDTLNQAVENVNSGYLCGRINKTDLASYLLIDASKSLTDKKIKEIQKAHLNKATYLKILAQKMKDEARQDLTPSELETLTELLNEGSPRPKKGSNNPDKTQAKLEAQIFLE